MDLFGLNRFTGGQEESRPQRGTARFFQAFWDNMGGLLTGNLLTFLGFLPLALGVSLGMIYENFFITLLSGCLGGAAAGIFWTPLLSLSVQAFRGGTRGWFRRWRHAAVKTLPASAVTGAVLGLLGGGLLSAGGFAGNLLAQGNRSPLPVWVILALDFFFLSFAAALIFPALCVGEKRIPFRTLWRFFAASPLQTLIAAGGTLFWCALLVSLFPVSVPFAVVIGFWPLSLLTAQLLLPALESTFSLPEPMETGFPKGASNSTVRQQGEIFWRRRWPVVVLLTACLGLLLWGGANFFIQREPDIQIAVVHAEPLPDNVRTALEDSLAALVGDLNGDGNALAQVNDYTMVFDGQAVDSDMQTAGATLLVTDVAAGVSSLYLTEAPQGFLERYADQVNAGHAALWQDCPVLSALDAGSYAVLEDMTADLPGRDLLDSLTVLPSRSAEDGILAVLLPGN